MDYSFTTIGALIGMAVAIILIIKKVQPAYSLILGALIGGVIGSGNLILTVDTMVSGAQSMISSVLRIMTSGILAGTLIKTGAAEKICRSNCTEIGRETSPYCCCSCNNGNMCSRCFCGYFSYYSSTYCTGDWKKRQDIIKLLFFWQ